MTASITLFGIMQTIRRKRSLQTTLGLASATARRQADKIREFEELCLLQSAEAAPLVLSSLFLGSITSITYESDFRKLILMPFAEAASHLSRAWIWLYLAPVQIVLYLLMHSSFFYMYFLFSNVFRKTANRKLFKNITAGPSNV